MGISYSYQKQRHMYGWKKDDYDENDFKVSFSVSTIKKLPSKIDLRKKFGDIYNQGELGSCTANAICAAFIYDQKKQNLKDFDPSRLFLYFNERDVENSVDTDSGASIRDGIKSINNIGLCEEKLWPYKIENFTNKPTDDCYIEAKFHKCIKYRRVRNKIDHLKASLSKGYPFIFGFKVYESFEDSKWDPSKEIMPLPKENEKVLGGHAVCAVGYSDKKKSFLIRNSWGESWGIGGYFLISYDFVSSKNCSDFWIIETVKESYASVTKKNKKSRKVEEETYQEEKIEDYDDTNYKNEISVKKHRDKIKKKIKNENNKVSTKMLDERTKIVMKPKVLKTFSIRKEEK